MLSWFSRRTPGTVSAWPCPGVVCSFCCSTCSAASAHASSSVGGESGPESRFQAAAGHATVWAWAKPRIRHRRNQDQVAQVTLIGRARATRWGPRSWSEMPEVFHALDADRECGYRHLTGSGKNFSYVGVPAMGGMFAR